MEFLAIMIVGTLAAIWVVVHSRPKHPIQNAGYDFPSASEPSPPVPPAWNKGAVYSEPMDDLEYLRAVERHDKDPAHYPFPSPPPRPHTMSSENERCSD